MKRDETFQYSRTPVDMSKYSGSPYNEGRASIIERLIPETHHGKAIDLGCGPGFFCRILRQKGWSVTAIDTDQENIRTASRFADEARVSDAITALSELPRESLDFALALEIIEHMPRRYGDELLRGILKVLRPGGMLVLSTPNSFSLHGLAGNIRDGSKWKAWDSTHVHVYSSWEIVRSLRACNFRIGRVVGYWYQAWLPLIGRCRLPLMGSRFFPLNMTGFNTIVQCRKK